jgi:hypothetical protein
MAQVFNEEDRADLLERGFNNEQIAFLESLEMDTESMYLDICKLMDDYGDSPSKIIVEYQRANEIPVTGGKKRKTRRNRRNKRTKKSRKSRTKKYRKSRR